MLLTHRLGNAAWMAAVGFTLMLTASSCSIEPPLNLAQGQELEWRMVDVVTEINVIWGKDDDSWRKDFWYGWDDEDIRRFGTIDYPEPTNYEARVFFHGTNPSAKWTGFESSTFFGPRHKRLYNDGYHNMLIWSNIDSPDQTQVLRINESDPDNIQATTSTSSLSYQVPGSRASAYNNPEIFYSGSTGMFHVSDNPADFDYYDDLYNVWVKELKAPLHTLVYTYLVQVVLYNNRDRVTTLADRPSMTSLASGVCINTGHTNFDDITATFEMRLKQHIPARGGRDADIFGGKLTTFGLCDMGPWRSARGPHYSGSRADLNNELLIDLKFSNTADKVFAIDVTGQMQAQAHGGVITVEIDVDKIEIPSPQPGGPGGSFKPVIADPDIVITEFDF